MNSEKVFNGLQKLVSPRRISLIGKKRLEVIAMIALLAIFSTSAICTAKSGDRPDKKSSNREEVDVNNFGKVTEAYYRGAQPKEDEYAALAQLGIKTIIDLRDDPKDYAKLMVEQLGMRYVNFPMSDKSYPAADAADKFLALVNDKENQPVYVHCAGGRHRTGAMTAVFRMKVQGWDVERAYSEMKDYDFYTRFGHKDMKTFVFDYYRQLLVSRRDEKKNNSVTTLGGENTLNR